MPRFVILLHELPSGHARASHWDLMLECGHALRTWALAGEPLSAPEIEAEQLPDHRLAYLDYEGPVSEDRGAVSRWDAGDYQVTSQTAEELRIALHGARFSGRLTLRQQADGHFWRVSFSAEPTTL
jgi:hypothetical protein